jgi:hypothetical protein
MACAKECVDQWMTPAKAQTSGPQKPQRGGVARSVLRPDSKRLACPHGPRRQGWRYCANEAATLSNTTSGKLLKSMHILQSRF